MNTRNAPNRFLFLFIGLLTLATAVPPLFGQANRPVPGQNPRGLVTCVLCAGQRARPCLACGGVGRQVQCVDLTHDSQALVQFSNQPCATCRGGRTVWCPLCSGTGNCTRQQNASVALCPHCSGQHTVLCRECMGRGSVASVIDLSVGVGDDNRPRSPVPQRACGSCGGHGQVLCYVCTGAGVVPAQQVQQYQAGEQAARQSQHDYALRGQQTAQSQSQWQRETRDYADYSKKKTEFDTAERNYKNYPNPRTERTYREKQQAYEDADQHYRRTDYGRR